MYRSIVDPFIPTRPDEIINPISQGRPDEIERNFMGQVVRNLLDYSAIIEGILGYTTNDMFLHLAD